MSWRTPAQLKDVLVEHIARDIKELQKLQSSLEPSCAVPSSSAPVYSLCDHLDHVLMHGLRDYPPGYWPFVRNFTRKDAIRSIVDLTQVNTDVGKGRAWLFMALNEQVIGSYLRLFLENQPTVSQYYYKEAFVHDTERLLLLDTLVAGLDFVIFNLTLNEGYLDYAASRPSAQLGRPLEISTVEPTFISKLASRLGPSSETNPVTIPAAVRVKAQDELSVSFAEGGVERSSGREAWQTQSLGPARLPSGPERLPSGPERLPREPVPLPPVLTAISEVQVIKGNAPNGGQPPKLERDGEEDEDEDDLVVHQRKGKVKKKKRKSKSKLQKDGDQKSGDGDQISPGHKEQTSDQREQKVAFSSETLKPSPDTKNSPPNIQKPPDSPPNIQKPPDNPPNIQKPPDNPPNIRKPPDSPPNIQKPPDSPPKFLKPPDSPPKLRKPVSSNPFDDDDDDEHSSAATQATKPAQPVGQSRLDTKPAQPVGQSRLDTKPAQPVGQSRLDTKPAQAVGQSRLDTKPAQPVGQSRLDTKPAQPVDWPNKSTDISSGLASQHHVRQPSPVVVGVSDTRTIYEETDGGTRHPLIGAGEEAHQSDSRKRSPHVFDTYGSTERDIYEGGRTMGPGPGNSPTLSEPVVKATASQSYAGITEADKHVADIRVDSNTKLVLSLEILFTTEEEAHQDRLVQVNTPYSIGLYKTAYVLVTNVAVYILRKDGAEGHYCREVGIHYKDFEHIVVGLDWQSLVLVYRSKVGVQNKYVLLTGSEAVSRSITESIQLAVKDCHDYSGSVALNKEDEVRINAIEKELIKLGSHTSMDIVKYSLVNWEQLKGDAPKVAITTTSPKMGYFQYKSSSSSFVFASQWKTGYFKLRNSHLCQFNNELDDVIRCDWDLKGKSIARGHVDNKALAISIMSGGENVLVLTASSEEEFALWMSALCEAATGQERDTRSSTHRTCLSCALLLTTNQIHVLQEDWSNETVKLVTSCDITDVNEISKDASLPFYCTIKYDHSGHTGTDTAQGVWLVCFSSEYELGRFTEALCRMWKAEMQIELSLGSVDDPQIRDRAHKAVELMLLSKWRSDSVTRGRSEHL